jgi:hypothetical protein
MCSTCFGLDMSRKKPEVPSLADALAKGFAELNTDDDNSSPVEEVPEVPEVSEVQESPDIESPSKPQYGRPAQHKAEENSFIVNTNTPTQTSTNDEEFTEKSESKEIEILEKPSTSFGDDFDVEW